MEQQRFVRKNNNVIEAQRRQDRKRTRRSVFYVLLFLFVSLIFLAVCIAVFLKVNEITVQGNERYSYEEIIEHVPINMGENIYAFDAERIENEILTNLPYIGKVEVNRDLPTTVEVLVTEETPYYATELAGDSYILSSNLKVLECRRNTKAETLGMVPIKLSNVRRCLVGSNIEFVSDRNLAALTALYNGFVENEITDKIKSIDFDSRFDITINYDGRFKVYVGDTDNINLKLKFLISIIDELEPNSTGVIDVSNPQEASVALS